VGRAYKSEVIAKLRVYTGPGFYNLTLGKKPRVHNRKRPDDPPNTPEFAHQSYGGVR